MSQNRIIKQTLLSILLGGCGVNTTFSEKDEILQPETESDKSQDPIFSTDPVFFTDPEFFFQNSWALSEGYVNPNGLHTDGSKTFSKEYFTQAFFRQLSRNVSSENYEAALCSFMPADEREYGVTLGASTNPANHLIS